jgi:hypothetical protein
MNRTLSVMRRRPHYIDARTPIVYGVAGYRLKWAANFDGIFTTFLTSTNVGFLDENVPRGRVDSQPTQGSVRMVFDPTTYAIPDTNHIWLELFHVAPGGAETQVSAPLLILPDGAHHGYNTVTLHGTAPSGVSVANSLQLDLPSLMYDFRVHNEEGATILYVATQEGGSETQLKPDAQPQMATYQAPQGSLWVRGAGATAAFSATFTLAFPK